MKTIFRLISLVIILGGWGLAAMSLHVVRTPDGYQLMTKNRLQIAETWLDTRLWTASDINKYPAFAQRLIDLNKEDVLAHVTDVENRDDLDKRLHKAVASAPVDTSFDWVSLFIRVLPK